MEHLGQAEVGHGVGPLIAYCILVGGGGTLELAETAVAFGHFRRHLATEGTLFLLGELIVYFAVSLCCVAVFAAGKLLVGGGKLRTAAAGNRRSHCAHDSHRGDSVQDISGFHNII